MWLSLTRIASYRPMRWLRPPPAATACFSSARRPGVVLRVSSTSTPVPAQLVDARAPSRSRCPTGAARKLSADALAGQQRARVALELSDRARAAPRATRPPARAALDARRAGRGAGTPPRRRRGRRPRPAPSARSARRRACPGSTTASVVRSPAPTSSASARAIRSSTSGVEARAGTRTRRALALAACPRRSDSRSCRAASARRSACS